MADKTIGIKLDVRQTGLQQVDEGLESISENLKSLNQSVLKQQQQGWGSESQTKEIREQLRYMQQMVQLHERLARTQGRTSESFGNFSGEIGRMQSDLSSVPSYRSGAVGGYLQNRIGTQATQSLEKMTANLGKIGTAYAGFNILSTLNSGLDRGAQLSFGYGDISKRMNPSNRNTLDYAKDMRASFSGKGYDNLDVLNSVKSYSRVTGRNSDLKGQMNAMIGVGQRYGLDLSEVTSAFGNTFQQGVTGGSQAQMNPQQFATLVANATVQASMQGKEMTMVNQLSQLTQMSIQSMGQSGNAKTMSAILAMGDRTGNQALIGNLPSMIGGIDQGISNPSGGYAGQALMMRAIGGGKMNFWDLQMQMSEGAFGVNKDNGKTNMENATDYLMKSFSGNKNRQAVMLGQMFNMNPSQAKQYIDTYTKDGKFDSDSLNQISSQMSNTPTDIPLNDTDNYRIDSQSPQNAADKTGQTVLPTTSKIKQATGATLNTGLGTGMVIGGIGVAGMGAIYKAYTGAKVIAGGVRNATGGGVPPAIPPTGPTPIPPTGGASGLTKFLGPLGTAISGISAAQAGNSLYDYIFGHKEGELEGGFHLNPMNTLDKWKDTREPIWRRKGNVASAATPDTASTVDPTTSATSITASPSAMDGSMLAPLVVSTIMALTPYMTQIRGVLGLDSNGGSAGGSPSANSVTPLLSRSAVSGSGSPYPGLIVPKSESGSEASTLPFSFTDKLPSNFIPKQGTSATYNTSKSATDAISKYAKEYGVPEYIAYSIAMAESSLNPNDEFAESNGSKSYGLYQLNSGGQGKGMTNAQLKNPDSNAKVGLQNIGDAYKKAKAKGMQDGPDTAMWVAENSGHPGYGVHSELDDKIRSNAQGIINGTVKIQAGSLDINIRQPDGSTQKQSVSLNAEYTGIGN